MRFAIVLHEDGDIYNRWQNSCNKFGIAYDEIYITRADWLEQCLQKPYDCFLLRPPGLIQRYKQLYDERMYVLAKILGKKTYPTYEELIIHENKRMLSYFLKAKQIPHVPTSIFYNKKEALSHISNMSYPVVAKTAIGGSGSGVAFLYNTQDATRYIIKAFGKGIARRFGPNKHTGNIKTWTQKTLLSPSFALKKIRTYLNIFNDRQQGYVIFQQYIPHTFEWRVVCIGESFFGHKKIKIGEKASGSKGIDYCPPPAKLLYFCKDIMSANNFTSMAIDCFETSDGNYLINEMQTIFGHVQTHILEVNATPGRYLYRNDQWEFEAGNFNTNESYDLRLQHVLSMLHESKK